MSDAPPKLSPVPVLPEAGNEAKPTAVPTLSPVSSSAGRKPTLPLAPAVPVVAPVEQPQAASAAAPLSSSAPRKATLPATPAVPPVVRWPASGPTLETAEAALCRAHCPKELEGLSAELLSSLSEVESNALWGNDSAVDVTPIRNAIIGYWWLRALLRFVPDDSAIDVQALDKVLLKVDELLATVVAPEGADEAVAAAFSSSRARLVRCAMSLADVAARLTRKDAQAASNATIQKNYGHVIGMVSYADTQRAGMPRRQKIVYASFAVMSVITIAFHLTMSLGEKTPFLPPGAEPQGVIAEKNPVTGEQLFLVVDPGQANAALEAKRRELEESGQTLKEVGPGIYMEQEAKP